MLRFAILHHTDWPGHAPHYDLFLQLEPGANDDDPVLLAFASLTDEFPDGKSHSDLRARGLTSGDPAAETNILKLNNQHRRAYLTLEGAVSGGRGLVQRVETGTLEWLRPPGDYQEFRVTLQGTQLKGPFRLRHLGQGLYHFERMKRVL